MPVEIRSIERRDARAVRRLARRDLPRDVADFLAGPHDAAWLLRVDRRLAGLATIDALPGLPDQAALDGFIAPVYRRRGHGRQLLDHLCAALAAGPWRRLSHPVPGLDTPAARFLLSQRFTVNHVEDHLRRPDLANLPAAHFPPGYHIEVGQPGHTVARFISIYDAAFIALPWYQPYTADEVRALLARPDDILFLTHGGRDVGVAWLRRRKEATGQIEPIGLRPDFRGRGLGRQLMLAALHALAEGGAQAATIGYWRDNVAAGRLYHALGFRPATSTTYLARDVTA